MFTEESLAAARAILESAIQDHANAGHWDIVEILENEKYKIRPNQPDAPGETDANTYNESGF